MHLPRTDFHLHLDNPASRLFWGRTRVQAASSCFYFHKGSRVQHLIHGLKYKGRKDPGLFLGHMYGEVLKNQEIFSTIDLVVPVPLHPRKLRKRGYNQSEVIAHGMARGMGLSMNTKGLVKITATETQTRKSRFSRWENVKEVFTLVDKPVFENKHILLVDDVITTGATLEACANTILMAAGARVSIATLACALK
jgi:ComF family protein